MVYLKLRILCKSTFGQRNCKTFWLVVVGERMDTQKNNYFEYGLRLEKEWMRSGCPSLDFASFKLGNPNLVLPNFYFFSFFFLECPSCGILSYRFWRDLNSMTPNMMNKKINKMEWVHHLWETH